LLVGGTFSKKKNGIVNRKQLKTSRESDLHVETSRVPNAKNCFPAKTQKKKEIEKKKPGADVRPWGTRLVWVIDRESGFLEKQAGWRFGEGNCSLRTRKILF